MTSEVISLSCESKDNKAVRRKMSRIILNLASYSVVFSWNTSRFLKTGLRCLKIFCQQSKLTVTATYQSPSSASTFFTFGTTSVSNTSGNFPELALMRQRPSGQRNRKQRVLSRKPTSRCNDSAFPLNFVVVMNCFLVKPFVCTVLEPDVQKMRELKRSFPQEVPGSR